MKLVLELFEVGVFGVGDDELDDMLQHVDFPDHLVKLFNFLVVELDRSLPERSIVCPNFLLFLCVQFDHVLEMSFSYSLLDFGLLLDLYWLGDRL